MFKIKNIVISFRFLKSDFNVVPDVPLGPETLSAAVFRTFPASSVLFWAKPRDETETVELKNRGDRIFIIIFTVRVYVSCVLSHGCERFRFLPAIRRSMNRCARGGRLSAAAVVTGVLR